MLLEQKFLNEGISVVNRNDFGILNEALTPSEFRPFMKIGRQIAMQRIGLIWPRLLEQADYTNRKIDDNRPADRLYFELGAGSPSELISKSSQKISDLLNKYGYFIKDYTKGIVNKKEDKRDFKLGSILTMLSKTEPEAKTLLNAYNNEKSVKALGGNYIMVISRHPYDIGGMSTDRSWTSCMDLRNTESNKQHFLKIDVEQGTIVSYLLNKDDLNIKKPIARIAIKPYINIQNENDVLYGLERVDTVMYGREHEGYINKLINVLDIAQNEKTGIFQKETKLYSSNEEIITKSKLSQQELEKLTSKFKKLKDGLTIQSIIDNHVWLLKASFKDAIIGQDEYGDLIWYNGIWKKGKWLIGTWKKGTWEYGTWGDGIWENGTWLNGTWENGVWLDGIWKKGVWQNGAWENGVWETGYIYNPSTDKHQLSSKPPEY